MNSNIVDIGSVLVGMIPDLIHQCHIAIAIDPGHQSKLHHISIQGPGPGLNLPQDIPRGTVHHTGMRMHQVDTGLIPNLLYTGLICVFQVNREFLVKESSQDIVISLGLGLIQGHHPDIGPEKLIVVHHIHPEH